MNNIIENNKLIAEFMGYKLMPCNNGLAWESPHTKVIDDKFNLHGKLFHTKGSTHYDYANSYLKFDSEWNWLMEVIQAIEEKGFVVAIRGISCAIYPLLKDNPEDYISSFVCGNLSRKIDIVYSAIIGFIKWYNQQSK
jgi:hypothetical protein